MGDQDGVTWLLDDHIEQTKSREHDKALDGHRYLLDSHQPSFGDR